MDNWIEQHDRKVYSQRGEDGRIEKILETLGENDRWCVEFGSWDGIYNSNVLNVVRHRGYRAVMIEGSDAKFPELVKNMKGLPVHPLHAFVGWEGDNRLDALLAKTPIPANFDLLSIDIDGNDHHVWRALEQYRPKCVVIEFNPTIHDEVSFVQEPSPRLNHGSSLKALVELGKAKGYELVSANLNNAFFVDNKYFSRFAIADNSIARLRTDKSRLTYLFSGYDGTVFVRGFGQLDLHGLPFDERSMQRIPAFLRGYDDSRTGMGRLRRILKKWHKSLKKRRWI